jgi:hypothetical protein
LIHWASPGRKGPQPPALTGGWTIRKGTICRVIISDGSTHRKKIPMLTMKDMFNPENVNVFLKHERHRSDAAISEILLKSNPRPETIWSCNFYIRIE